MLSSWLYGVAYRVAVRSRSDVLQKAVVRDRWLSLDVAASLELERRLKRLSPFSIKSSAGCRRRLRSPLVLCYLKDCTHDQAAAELRWPVGTVRSRLARARELLRERLTRPGVSPRRRSWRIAGLVAAAVHGFGTPCRSGTRPCKRRTGSPRPRWPGTRRSGLFNLHRVGHDPRSRSAHHHGFVSDQDVLGAGLIAGRACSREASARAPGAGIAPAGPCAPARPAAASRRSRAGACTRVRDRAATARREFVCRPRRCITR